VPTGGERGDPCSWESFADQGRQVAVHGPDQRFVAELRGIDVIDVDGVKADLQASGSYLATAPHSMQMSAAFTWGTWGTSYVALRVQR